LYIFFPRQKKCFVYFLYFFIKFGKNTTTKRGVGVKFFIKLLPLVIIAGFQSHDQLTLISFTCKNSRYIEKCLGLIKNQMLKYQNERKVIFEKY
jgi:hypothetical protein